MSTHESTITSEARSEHDTNDVDSGEINTAGGNVDGNGETGDSDADRWEPVRALPPSAKLVAKILDRHDRLTQRELATETLLATRTVRQAVGRLEDAGVVESRVSFLDARKQLYRLTI